MSSGRGGYSSGRGGYHSGGGYRGGHGGGGGGIGGGSGVDQGGHHHSSHFHHQPGVSAPSTVAAVTSKTPPAPEFEMKGNDFPALPGVATPVIESRKTSESDGSTPWDSNR